MPLLVRDATAEDLPALARMGAQLVRQHHALDAQRFLLSENLEAGYAWWFDKERRRKTVVLLAAELEGEVIGYAYARSEPRDWNLLRDACGVLHDLWVEEKARRSGAGRALAEAVADRFGTMGLPRIVLMSASGNSGAQAFFQRLGWRPTMVEMTRELPPPQAPRKRRRTDG